jgi:hypothetical protein
MTRDDIRWASANPSDRYRRGDRAAALVVALVPVLWR